jgi:indolepyruvate decarboxylase
MTGMELATVAKENLNPIVILLNNDEYRTERALLDGTFNDIFKWNYSKITDLLGRGKSYVVERVRKNQQRFCVDRSTFGQI